MNQLPYATTQDGRIAAGARVRAAVAAPATEMPQSLRRAAWYADAAVDLTCGFPTAMKVHERRPEEGSS